MKNFFVYLSLLAIISCSTSKTTTTQNTTEAKFQETKTKLYTDTKQLTFSGTKSGEGYFSLDSSLMIFQSDRDTTNPFYQMYIMNLKNGKTNRVSTGSGMTTCGWIHPSMTKAMWSSSHEDPLFEKKKEEELEKRKNPVQGRYSWGFDEGYDIYSSDLNGKNIKRLTNTLGYDAEGSYSNNGKWIAFASNRNAYKKEVQEKWTEFEWKMFKQDPSYFMDIYIMNEDGSNVKQLTFDDGYDGGPFFSPDSKKIVWRKFNKEGTLAEIYTMNVDGTNQKKITNFNSMSWAPFFHPSGKYIIFTSAILGFENFELFIVDAEGLKKPVRVTYLDGFDGLPVFTPDGKKLSWTRKDDKGESQIYWADWNHAEALKSLGLQDLDETYNFDTLTTDITEADVKKIIGYLSSDEMHGRMTGSSDEEIYQQKFKTLLKSWGLEVRSQEFSFISKVSLAPNNKASFSARYKKDLVLGSDYQVSSSSTNGVVKPMPIVFAGFGISAPSTSNFQGYDSYTGLDVKDKWVLFFEGEPIPEKRDIEIHRALVPYSGLQHKITLAKNKGAKGVILVTQNSENFEFKSTVDASDSNIPALKLKRSILDELLKSKNTTTNDLLKEINTYKVKEGFNFDGILLSGEFNLVRERSKANNVIAVLNPENKSYLKNKAIIIGAHGDHLGLGGVSSSLAKDKGANQIHNGADDNASGVSGVMELAHYFSTKKNTLTRPLYFAIWSGEEIGVLGSNAFASDFKKMFKKDLKDAVFASLNMDMIGRLNNENKLFVQGVGSSLKWSDIIEEVSFLTNSLGVKLTTTSDPYLPTDAISFYLAGIPSISFFTGSHKEYHTPQDRYETINFEGTTKIINVVKTFTENLLSKNDLPYVKVESSSKNEGRKFRITLGTIPDYTAEGIKGVKISGTMKGSPAETAGLQDKDIIVEFDGVKIDSIYDFVYTLETVKADVETTIKVLRDNKEVSFKIVPKLKE